MMLCFRPGCFDSHEDIEISENLECLSPYLLVDEQDLQGILEVIRGILIVVVAAIGSGIEQQPVDLFADLRRKREKSRAEVVEHDRCNETGFGDDVARFELKT